MKEYKNRFVNPIMNGSCADSRGFDVKLMKQRAHILHELLDGLVGLNVNEDPGEEDMKGIRTSL